MFCCLTQLITRHNFFEGKICWIILKVTLMIMFKICIISIIWYKLYKTCISSKINLLIFNGTIRNAKVTCNHKIECKILFQIKFLWLYFYLVVYNPIALCISFFPYRIHPTTNSMVNIFKFEQHTLYGGQRISILMKFSSS